MNTPLTFTRTRQQELSVPGHDRLAASPARERLFGPVVVRLATAADLPALAYLADLDSAKRPVGETLIGERYGRPVVALGLSDGSVVADPFVPTSEVTELLRLRAAQLSRPARKYGRSFWRSSALKRAALTAGTGRRAIGVT